MVKASGHVANATGQLCIYFVYVDGTSTNVSPVTTCLTETSKFTFNI